MKKTNVLVVICLSFFLFNCKKGEDFTTQKQTGVVGIPNVEAKVENGVLVFSSHEDMNKYLEYVSSKTYEEISNIEKMNNFISYDRKIQQILREYESLCETHYSNEQIQSFRAKYSKYIEITDSTFEEKNEGLFNLISNSEGYFQIDENVNRIVGNKIFTTSESNKLQLNSVSITADATDLISMSEFKKNAVKINNDGAEQVNQWQSKQGSYTKKCRRYHRTNWILNHYTSQQVPIATSNVSSYTWGFKLCVRNYKRGWTGIWYAQSRNNNFNGNYGSPYYGWVPFNDSQNTSNFIKYYNVKTWTRYGYYTIQEHNDWVNNWILPGLWAYTTGNLTYDVCGNRTVNL